MSTPALACSCIVKTANIIAETLDKREKLPADIENIEKLLIEADSILNKIVVRLNGTMTAQQFIVVSEK